MKWTPRYSTSNLTKKSSAINAVQRRAWGNIRLLSSGGLYHRRWLAAHCLHRIVHNTRLKRLGCGIKWERKRLSWVQKHKHLLVYPTMTPPSAPIYTIPDLLTTWPWARAKNPDLQVVQNDANAWVESLNLFKPAQLKKFKACEFSEYCALPYSLIHNWLKTSYLQIYSRL